MERFNSREAVVTKKPCDQQKPYSPAVGEHICERVALGESLVAICEPADMPSLDEVMAWQRHDPEFAALLGGAWQARAEIFLDRVLETIDRLGRGDIATAEAEVIIEGLKLLVETCDAYGPRKFIVLEGEVTLVLPDGSEALLRPTGLTVMATGLH